MSLRKRWGLGCISVASAVLAASSASEAATIRHDVADAGYAALSAAPGFSGSGFISVDSDTTPGGSFNIGSGTLVASNWVLTAAHVVTRKVGGVQTPWPVAQITFGQGPERPLALVGTYEVAEVVVASGWNGSIDNGRDMALIRLTSSVAGANPAPLYNAAALGSELNKNATIVGYQSRSGTGLTGNKNEDLARRAQTNVIDAFGGQATSGRDAAGNSALYSAATSNSEFMIADFDSPDNNGDGNGDDDPSDFYNLMGGGDPTSFEGAQVGGDSGGGLFINVGGTEYLAGVTSFVGRFTNSPFANSGFQGFYGDYNGYTRVSQYLDFINTTIPEPGSLTLALGLALALGTRRPRRRAL